MGRWVWICFVFQACVAKYAQIQQVSVAKFARGSTEEKAEQVQKLRTAFETKGMVVLVDVGFPEGLIEKTMSKSREFFELPLHLKEKHGEPSGYPPRSYGAVTVPTGKFYKTQQKDDPGNILNEWLLVKNTTVPIDWKDPYYSSDEGQEFYSSISKHPEQQQWPAEVPGLQEVTGAFYREMEKLATTMQELFALALGISKDFFSSRSQRAPIWPVTIAHYPPQEVAPAEDKERIQPHWDRTLFSLITTSDAGDEDSEGGLQILVDKETGDGVDGRAEMEGRSTEWQKVRRPPGGFIINVGEIMSRWSNGRLKHVVHRVPNPKPGHPDLGRISLMAFVVPDYDAVVECIHCKEDGSTPIYEKTWVGEMMNWGSRLPIYNQTKMEMMRMAQGLYSTKGDQVKLGDPTDVKSLEKQLTKKAIPVLDIAALQNGTQEEQKVAARRLSEAFERTGFAVVTGHPVPPEHMRNLRIKAYQFFRSPLEEKKKFDKGKGYGFGGYNNQRESGAQLLGDFSRPVDMVESLHAGLAGLRAGVEGIQLRGTDEGAKDGHCSIKDISGCEMEESTPPVLSRSAASFLHAIEGLAKLVAKALQLSLNVTNEELDLVIDPVNAGLRLAYYPSKKEGPKDGQMGYGQHVDSGGVTMISLDPANPHGLQVDISGVGTNGKDQERLWADVPFIPDSFVLNVGALLSRWTGNKWKASVHRVLFNEKSHERLSIITGALSPKIDGPAFAGFQQLATYPPVKAEDYLGTRVALHRAEYAEERGLKGDAIEKESEQIRQLNI
ncbi:unnamed protein product [Durusdinium trenchii]|uniref:2-oxoglutarate-Fe(II) type oxidoreductase hxnY (Nicotinate catabolism cluster protein hxnY) n=2 Tax=Durusdinium trenchii TaxID=1381693 RepID=A0ABP0QGD2_9DINO